MSLVQAIAAETKARAEVARLEGIKTQIETESKKRGATAKMLFGNGPSAIFPASMRASKGFLGYRKKPITSIKDLEADILLAKQDVQTTEAARSKAQAAADKAAAAARVANAEKAAAAAAAAARAQANAAARAQANAAARAQAAATAATSTAPASLTGKNATILASQAASAAGETSREVAETLRRQASMRQQSSNAADQLKREMSGLVNVLSKGTSQASAATLAQQKRDEANALKRKQREAALSGALSGVVGNLTSQSQQTSNALAALARQEANATLELQRRRSAAEAARQATAAATQKAALASQLQPATTATAADPYADLGGLNANNNSGPLSSSSSAPSGAQGTPEGLPPPPQEPPPLLPDPEAARVLSEAAQRARVASKAAVNAEDAARGAVSVLDLLKDNPINTTPLRNLEAIRERLAREKAVLKESHDTVTPVIQTIATKQASLRDLEAEIAALVAKRQGLVIPNGMNVNQQMRIQQQQVDIEDLLEQRIREQAGHLAEIGALDIQLSALNELIAEHARQLQPLEAQEADLTGKAANVKKRQAEIAAAEAAAAEAQAAAKLANRQLLTIHEESNENNASSSSSGNNSNSRSVGSNNNNNNNNNNNTGVPTPEQKQIMANIRSRSGNSLSGVTPRTPQEIVHNLKYQRRYTKKQRNMFEERQRKLGLTNSSTKGYNIIGNTKLETRANKLINMLDNLHKNSLPRIRAKTTSKSPMTKRWRCTKPGTDIPCTTTGGRRKHRHRRTQKQKYSRKLNARTKRTKRQRR
jgi:hypothetical protein